jgi:hypothetical protein
MYEPCDGSQPCIVEFNKHGNRNNMSSMTHLGDLIGHMSDRGRDDLEQSLGAEFKHVKYQTPFYEKMKTYKFNRPWLAKHQEHTFMNRIKELNEAPVKTYDSLKLSPISQDKYDSYVPTIYVDPTRDYNEIQGEYGMTSNNKRYGYPERIENFNSLIDIVTPSSINRKNLIKLLIILLFIFIVYAIATNSIKKL